MLDLATMTHSSGCRKRGSFRQSRITGKERDTEAGLDYFGARYYGSKMGRFLTPDWSELPVAVPWADFENPQSLNLYGYVKNNPATSRDADGHSDLVYDGKTKTMTLYSSNGQKIGSWHANNRVDSHASLRGLPDGKYKFQDTKSPHHHQGNDKHGVPKDSAKGEYGSFGIFRLEPFKADGSTHEGVGVHSGREGVPDKSAEHGEGADHVTQGCLRSCDPAMHQITETAKTDPLKTLTVENNRPPQPQPPPPPEPKKEEPK
jgi:RHS repeat-associated protein